MLKVTGLINNYMSNIRLHPKYGMNPTMPICILCGKETGEIALLGASYKEEAPKNMVVGIEPCKTCRKNYLKDGVMLVEVIREYKGGSQVESITGNIIVLKDVPFKNIFNIAIPKSKIVKTEVGVIDRIRDDAKQHESKINTKKAELKAEYKVTTRKGKSAGGVLQKNRNGKRG